MAARPPLLALGALAAVAAIVAALLLRGDGPAPASAAPAVPAEAPPPARDREARLAPVPEEVAAEGSAAESAAESTADVHGRVVDAETEELLAGIPLVLFQAGEERARATSDAGGAFRLAPPPDAGRDGLVLSAELPEGAALEGGARELDEDEARGLEPVVLRVVRAASAPVAGRVLDERTGEPAPAVDVHAVGDGVETIRTDGDGSFRTRGAWPGGPIRITVRDGAGEDRVLLGSFDEEHFAAPHLRRALELRVPVGPTYRLDLEGLARAHPGPWRFRLVEREGDPRVAGRLAPDARLQLRLAGPPPAPRVWTSVPLRLDATGAWVRFPRVEHEPAEGWRPELVGSHRMFRARAEVGGTVGIDPVLRRPALEPSATVTGSVQDAAGGPVPGVAVRLFPGGGDHWYEDRPDWRAARLGARGTFRIEDVPPGPWRLAVEAAGHHVEELSVDVRQGANEVDPIELVAARAEPVVAGRVHVRPFSPEPLAVALAPRGRDSVAPWRFTTTAQGGEFRFEELPVQAYDVFAFSESGEAPVLRRENVGVPTRYLELEGQHELVELRLVGPEGARRMGTFVQDLGRGVLAPRAWGFAVSLGGEDPPPWRVWVAGRRPVRGGEDETSEEVRLEHGWGAALHLRELRDPGSDDVVVALRALGYFGRGQGPPLLEAPRRALFEHAPVRGVEVVSEHGLAGVTGPDGSVLVDLPVPPKELTLLREGWRARVVEPVVTSHDGSHEYTVWMVRDDPLVDGARADEGR